MRVGLLRFITAGSVDDGKSTLIGRLLVDARGAGGYALGLGSFMATFSVRDPIRAGPVRAAVDWRDDIGGAWGTAMLTIIPSGPNRAERP